MALSAPSDVLRLVAGGLDREAVGALAGRPLLAVSLGPDPALAQLAQLLTGLPCVLVGVAPSGAAGAQSGYDDVLGAFDVLLAGTAAPPPPFVGGDVAEALRQIDAVVRAAPAASVALVQLLRWSPGLPVADAVVAESFVYSMLQSGALHRSWLARQPHRPPRPADAGPSVRTERRGGELEIELCRPDVRNAFSSAMRDELVAIFGMAVADPSVDAICVRGEGPAFCSGGRLDEFGLSEDPALAHLVRTTRNAGLAVASCATRTTFEVHGACVGAGVELAAFAGRVVAAPGTVFHLPEVSMGLVPGAGGTASIPRRIGRHRTAYLALSGRWLDVDTARTWGLVDELGEPTSPGG